MESLQRVTTPSKATSTAPGHVTDPRHQALIDYRALSGLITDDDGMRKMPAEELANNLGVARKTLYEWEKSIPNFWQLVNERRAQIGNQARLAKVEETFYLKAVKGDWQFTNAWLLNYKPGYKTPTTKIEHEVGNSWAALLAAKRPQANDEPIEGEVINEPSSD